MRERACAGYEDSERRRGFREGFSHLRNTESKLLSKARRLREDMVEKARVSEELRKKMDMGLDDENIPPEMHAFIAKVCNLSLIFSD